VSEGPCDLSGLRHPAGGPVSVRSSPGPHTGSQRVWTNLLQLTPHSTTSCPQYKDRRPIVTIDYGDVTSPCVYVYGVVICSGCGARADVKARRCDRQPHRRSHILDVRRTGSDVSVARRRKTTRRLRCASTAQCNRLSNHLNEHR